MKNISSIAEFANLTPKADAIVNNVIVGESLSINDLEHLPPIILEAIGPIHVTCSIEDITTNTQAHGKKRDPRFDPVILPLYSPDLPYDSFNKIIIAPSEFEKAWIKENLSAFPDISENDHVPPLPFAVKAKDQLQRITQEDYFPLYNTDFSFGIISQHQYLRRKDIGAVYATSSNNSERYTLPINRDLSDIQNSRVHFTVAVNGGRDNIGLGTLNIGTPHQDFLDFIKDTHIVLRHICDENYFTQSYPPIFLDHANIISYQIQGSLLHVNYKNEHTPRTFKATENNIKALQAAKIAKVTLFDPHASSPQDSNPLSF